VFFCLYLHINYIGDTMRNEYKLSITPNSVTFDDLSEIVNFSSHEVIVKYPNTLITLRGSNLYIKELFLSMVIVKGDIEGISFKDD